MVVSALFLSNTVSHIVLTPLESGPIHSVLEPFSRQLLDHVHHMAANIFKSAGPLDVL